MNNIEVDARQVVSMFADLTSRQQRQVYRSALRKGAGILVGETKRQLRQTLGRAASSRNWWNGKTLISGIKANADRNGEKAKVHIMGDFRLSSLKWVLELEEPLVVILHLLEVGILLEGREQQPIEVVLMQHISLEQLKPIRKGKSLIIWITL